MRQQNKSITETTSVELKKRGIHYAGNKLSKHIAPESMHLNALGTSAVLPLLVTAQLIDVFQLVVETQETELIHIVSLNSFCMR